jgi:hypothetical protein
MAVKVSQEPFSNASLEAVKRISDQLLLYVLAGPRGPSVRIAKSHEEAKLRPAAS